MHTDMFWCRLNISGIGSLLISHIETVVWPADLVEILKREIAIWISLNSSTHKKYLRYMAEVWWIILTSPCIFPFSLSFSLYCLHVFLYQHKVAVRLCWCPFIILFYSFFKRFFSSWHVLFGLFKVIVRPISKFANLLSAWSQKMENILMAGRLAYGAFTCAFSSAESFFPFVRLVGRCEL